ncbi:MAG: tetratricopeptide repeat protein [Deltaproteobacteria bacterium]|nr:tetratricopeptide repeat protein [Deltaproteobacteria bacterium]
MYLSKTKIGAFIVAILILGWLLYPRELFLAFIYEGFTELKQAEEFYLTTLEKRTHNKFASLRLAQLYERMGEPEKATPILKDLQRYRAKDWETAEVYLSHLERTHNEEALYEERLRIANQFQKDARFPKRKVQELLDAAYAQARWHQRSKESLEILSNLISYSPQPKPYQLEQQDLDRALKRSEEVIATLQEKIQNNPDDKASLEELIRVYRVIGHHQQAEVLIQSGLARFPKDLELLKIDADLKKERGRHSEALPLYREIVGLLEVKLEKKPGDFVTEKELIYLYLYELEDDSKLHLFEKYVESSHDETIAIDVALLLEKKNHPNEALQWLRRMNQLFPDSDRIALKIAYLESVLGNPEKAKEIYEKLAETHKNDPKILSIIGKELFFLGETKKSKEILQRAIHLKPSDFESWFWFGEIQHSEGEKKGARGSYQKVLDLTRVHKTPLEQKRIMLKSAARLSFDDKIKARYRQLIREHPDSSALVTDFLELLIENRQWEEAIPILEEFKKRKPKNWASRRDLANAYVESRRWVLGIYEYEEISQATNAADISLRLKELHEKYDTRVGPTFQWLDLGTDDLIEWGLEANDYLDPEWELKIQATAGRYRSPGLNFSGVAEHGRLSLTNTHFKNTEITVGSGYGFSTARKTGSPLVEFAYQFSPQFHLKTGFEIRALRTDIPQAVRAGSIQDRAFFQYDLTLWNRLLFLSTYRYSRNVLPSGSRSHEQLVEPSLSWIVSHRPYLSIGYLFSFVHLTDEGGYLNTVSLLPKIHAHYLTTSLDYPVHQDLSLEWGFFIGEDTARNLHIWQADLFGTRAGFKWAPLSWLDVHSSYEFGRESLPGLPGEGHRVRTSISGHWF